MMALRSQGLSLKFRVLFQRVLEGVVLVLVTTLALVVVSGVVFRKLGLSLVWYDEVASINLAWLTYYGAALAAFQRSHIGMPTLMVRLSRPLRLPFFVFAEFVVLAFFVVLAWTGWQVQSVLAGTTLVSLPSVPAALAQSVIPIGAALFIVGQIASIPDALAKHEFAYSARQADKGGSGLAVEEGVGL